MNSLSGIPSRGVPSQHEAPRSFLVFDSFIRWSLQWIRFHPTWGILTGWFGGADSSRRRTDPSINPNPSWWPNSKLSSIRICIPKQIPVIIFFCRTHWFRGSIRSFTSKAFIASLNAPTPGRNIPEALRITSASEVIIP